MGVKLLSKSELSALKQKAQERDIREGVKIASRVDGLRELWGKTEQDFELYKTSTLATIQGEINKKIEEKQTLEGDLRQMKATYDALMPDIPLKRKELAQFEKSLTAWEKKIKKREEVSLVAEIDVAEALKKADFARVRNEENERTTANLLRQANKKKELAEQALRTAQNIQLTAEKEKKAIESSLSLRELSMQAQEKELLTNQMKLAEEQEELRIEKLRVQDMRETLERSLNRIKQGRLA